ncbi:unnamed protein product [Macrosiphum euphorbiae]|uniref:DUF4817 domain-containing protein n=1 Tax=Macrosiphum euphorbiae TaxID=13131 RepID=A0AAV0XWS1_9HEMI|nr:unnamed protein product [Macrosiphum euphorbiae]
MPLFTSEEKVGMIFVYRECNNNSPKSLELYRERFPTRNQPFRMIFSRLVNCLKKTGHFPDVKHQSHMRNVGPCINLEFINLDRKNPDCTYLDRTNLDRRVLDVHIWTV